MPHSEILGSKLVRSSPRLIAAYHVLLRLSAPRHPPNALMTLDCSHYRRPPITNPSAEAVRLPFHRNGRTTIEKTISCFEHIREHCGQAVLTVTIAPDSVQPVLTDTPYIRIGCVSSSQCLITRQIDIKCQSQRNCHDIKDERASGSHDLVEPDGIEPTTSCLQSTRSPN